MASGYQSLGYDLDTYCEPYVSAKPVSKSGYDLSSYNINGSPITNRYNKPSTDEWMLSVSRFYANGEPVPICRIGMLPTQTKFAEITSAGTYNITYDNSGITIGSTKYPASTFRGGRVPEYIGIIIAGAGGGGGGFGADAGDKNGYLRLPGGAGGGGGVGAYVISLSGRHEEPMLYQVIIGAGGSGGSWGSGDSRPSTGATGGTGGATQIICRERGITEDIVVATASGGSGGKGGGTSSNNYVAGGAGGTATTSMGTTTAGNPYGYYKGSSTGGAGGTYDYNGSSVGGGATSLTNFSFTTGAGVPTSTMYNNGTGGWSHSTDDAYRNCWQSGGASFGVGGTYSAGATNGGGGASNGNTNGASGYCAFYY